MAAPHGGLPGLGPGLAPPPAAPLPPAVPAAAAPGAAPPAPPPGVVTIGKLGLRADVFWVDSFAPPGARHVAARRQELVDAVKSKLETLTAADLKIMATDGVPHVFPQGTNKPAALAWVVNKVVDNYMHVPPGGDGGGGGGGGAPRGGERGERAHAATEAQQYHAPAQSYAQGQVDFAPLGMPAVVAVVKPPYPMEGVTVHIAHPHHVERLNEAGGVRVVVLRGAVGAAVLAALSRALYAAQWPSAEDMGLVTVDGKRCATWRARSRRTASGAPRAWQWRRRCRAWPCRRSG